MPTTSLSGWALANHGPLTTTYTAPASCFSVATQIQLGTVVTDSDTNMTSVVPFLGLCNTTASPYFTVGDCVPSGREIDSEYATVDRSNPVAGYTIDYYSPGLFCPSGYATVGVATNNAGKITSSGNAFVPTTSIDLTEFAFNPLPNILLQALDQGETAILCCPSSYTVDLYGDCYSALPTYPIPTEGCAYNLPPEDIITITSIVSVFGTPVTEGLLAETSSVPITDYFTSTLSDAEDWTAISQAPMITLVHKAAEATASGRPSSSSSTTTSGASGRAERSGKEIVLLSCFIASFTTSILYSGIF